MKTIIKICFITASVLILISGVMHVLGIFFSDDLTPVNNDIKLLMENNPIKMHPDGMLWDLWVGFHAMFGMCLIFIGIIVIILSTQGYYLLEKHSFISILIIIVIGFFVWIGRVYIIQPFVTAFAIPLGLLIIGFILILRKQHI